VGTRQRGAREVWGGGGGGKEPVGIHRGEDIPSLFITVRKRGGKINIQFRGTGKVTR